MELKIIIVITHDWEVLQAMFLKSLCYNVLSYEYKLLFFMVLYRYSDNHVP